MGMREWTRQGRHEQKTKRGKEGKGWKEVIDGRDGGMEGMEGGMDGRRDGMD
jgi:hypothetical protein